MKSILHYFAVVVFAVVVTVLPATMASADEAGVEAREKTFIEQMSNTVMVGSFTVDGKSDDKPLKEERYEIESVAKASDNLWIFTARVKYGNIDTKLPITVPMEWAGHKPMVSLTDATLPGLGSAFSARVIFYDGRYAGTWQHGKVGGHMFGRIEKNKDQSPSTTK